MKEEYPDRKPSPVASPPNTKTNAQPQHSPPRDLKALKIH
jgi:hypothetical protein